MNRRDNDRRAEIAAQLLEALYSDAPSPGQRSAVLDRITAAQDHDARTSEPTTLATRALEGAYGTPTSEARRSAVLDAITRARHDDPSMSPVREGLLALASTLAAGLIVGAVIVGVRHEGTGSLGHGGLTAEEHRAIPVRTHRPEAHPERPAPAAPRPGVAGTAAAPVLPTVHPAIPAMQRGCDQGSAVSCRRLGMLYQRGRGVAANHERAFELYDRACRAGDARGCTLRDAADRSLNDVDRDDRADAEYFSTLGL